MYELLFLFCFCFLYDSHVALFFHLLTNFTKDLPIDRPHPHPRSSIPLSKMLQYFIKCSLHRHRNIWWPKLLQSTCISSVNCTQNWELPVALSVTSKTFSDVKMKHEERVHNGLISSWTRVNDGVNIYIKSMACSLATLLLEIIFLRTILRRPGPA